MFYTLFTWIGCLFYGPSMAMPTIIILIKFPNQDENYIWLRLTVPGGILFTWPLRPSQNNLSLWPKELLPTVSLAGGFVCVAPFLSTVKILALLPSNTPINVLKSDRPSSCFQVGAVTQTMSRVA